MTKSLDELKGYAVSILEREGLFHLPGRPFDNQLSIFASSSGNKGRLIFVGINGNDSDADSTNGETIIQGFENPNLSNIRDAWERKNAWGRSKSPLPKRLKELALALQFDPEETVYTNSILLCAEREANIKDRLRECGSKMSYEQLAASSMHFFKDFTLRFSSPSAIIAYGTTPCATLYKELSSPKSEKTPLPPEKTYEPYWFTITYSGKRVPVLCIRHLSYYSVSQQTAQAFKTVIADHYSEAPDC